MLITPRLYYQYTRAQDANLSATPSPSSATSDGASVVYWSSLPPKVERHVKKMLLLHQTGSVKVGEVVRYTITYTPGRDRVRPIPTHLHLRVRNTCSIPLRAAYLHGPYTLYAACYPDTFNPNAKHDSETYGDPQFEPMLKAGGSWTSKLKIPETLRKACEETASNGEAPSSCTWIVECTSQVLFSASATVHYELIVGRDAKSVEAGFAGLTGSINSTPGRLMDHQEQKRKPGEHIGLMKGVFSNAITVVVEDTASLWNKPTLPGLEHFGFHEFQPGKGVKAKNPTDTDAEGHDEGTEPGPKNETDKGRRNKRKVHLVVISHGLHSNLGADMLYMKESIDAAAKQARKDARQRRKAEFSRVNTNPIHDYTSTSPPPPEMGKAKAPATSTAPLSGGQEDLDDEPEDDEEEVIVRGFSGNAIRTERGIQYLGKRLAKYVLGMTYPDQPFLPVKKSFKKTLSRTFTNRDKLEPKDGHEAHHNSSVKYGGPEFPDVNRPYQITSISFIGHSLGGLTQTYAIAYIHKHSPEFFQRIQPVNFIALASPFLGLSNENPLYVKFALDFGLVGRTGQDLGLTWRAPTIARNGWAGVIAGIGNERQRTPKKVDPGTKPLLRLLPAGPAHQALRMFRNRTVYSNVVNDGIVPLRTSCLLFLDWRGLGKVDKARRENGLIGAMAGWGWAEITGTNQSEHKNQWPWQRHDNGSAQVTDDELDESMRPGVSSEGTLVPQPADNETREDNANTRQNLGSKKGAEEAPLLSGSPRKLSVAETGKDEATSPLAGFMSLFGGTSKKEIPQEKKPKPNKLMRRAQTLWIGSDDESSSTTSPEPSRSRQPSRDGSTNDARADHFAPPKTSVFEAAGDLLNPPLPPTDFLLDPQSRPRTIFHDRVYHPDDIPPPPTKRRPTFMRKKSSMADTGRKVSKDGQLVPNTNIPPPPSRAGSETGSVMEVGNMAVEEKIARAYHRDLSWRKVLVRLQPDAHNNIVVRRMFANAYGWPVIKHLVDTHFADTQAALTADRKEDNVERARPMTEPASKDGDEVKEQRKRMSGEVDDERDLMYREAHDELQGLEETGEAVGSLGSSSSMSRIKRLDRQDSVASSVWTDRFFDGTDDDDSDEGEENGASTPKGTDKKDVDDFLFGKGVGDGLSKLQTSNDSGEARPPNSSKLVLPVENVTASPTSLTPKVGLGKSVEESLSMDDHETPQSSK